MNLYRFRLVPESPWRTPWQSDTLAGLLCWMCARSEGDTVLRQQIIEPALAGQPPFVLSDAFPGDWLRVPVAVRLLDSPTEQRKTVKRAQWLSHNSFARLQRGELPAMSQLIHDSGVREYTQLRNTIGRSSNRTTDGDGLFPTQESVLDKGMNYLTVYARLEPAFVELFWRLVKELAQWGFGSDRSAGKGQFHLGSELEPASELDAPADTDSFVVLSTFQPGAGDPTDGAWEAFTKYGKLGPDFGLENVFKRPMIVFRPGACFRGQAPRGWIGRAIRMHELLPDDVVGHLNGRGASVVHWAFGLCVPLTWPLGELGGPEAAPITGAAPMATQASRPASAPQRSAPTGGVKVKFLGPHEKLKNAFWVQEEGKKRGLLKYGTAPTTLPDTDSEIEVFRTNDNPQSPEYRWDKPAPPLQKKDRAYGGKSPPRRR